ncbi:hypothetical protein GGF46_001292 [Coemansia sp. RSA 552]|nr:hypothetical protein GGF46_001292 [Coemansia sp. RSA 552]
MPPDNTTVLTRGARVYAKKRRARRAQVEEVQFDPKERRSFLTGFHKRKVQRREKAQAEAKALERREALQMRRERRSEQQEQLAQKMFENKQYYDPAAAASGLLVDQDSSDEAEDDEGVEVLEGDSSVTTVTVTRDFDPVGMDDEESGLGRRLTPQELADKLKRTIRERAEAGPEDDADAAAETRKPKKRTKNFRYETKAKRAANNTKAKTSAASRNSNAATKRKTTTTTKRRS